jgi:peptidoglycan/xylan/chitin deacetylase (PgdA/CDA1 family)
VILMYHRMADEQTDLCVTPGAFCEQLGYLRETGYRVLPLRDLVAALQRDDIPPLCVAITFDDGYLDALTHAVPILEAFGFPATFFVVSSTLDYPKEFWWDTLERMFAYDKLPCVLDVALPEGVASMPTETPQERCLAFDAVRRTFYPLTLEQRRERIEMLMSWSRLPAPRAQRNARGMTRDEVRVLDGVPGMEVGAHTGEPSAVADAIARRQGAGDLPQQAAAGAIARA